MATGSDTYFEVLEAIKNYYGSGSDQWVEIAKYGIASDKAESILHQVPGVDIIKNADGSIRSYTYNAIESISNSASTINSNALSTQVKTKIPANMGVDSSTGNLTLKSGTAVAGNFVSTTVVPAVMAGAVGVTLGKTIDHMLYYTFPDLFDSHNLQSFNPETWTSIAYDDETLGTTVFNTLLGVNSDNTSQLYIDENALSYLTYYMYQNSFFDVEDVYNIDDKSGLSDSLIDALPIKSGKNATFNGNYISGLSDTDRDFLNITSSNKDVYILFNSSSINTQPIVFSKKSFSGYARTYNIYGNYNQSIKNIYNFPVNNKNVYLFYGSSGAIDESYLNSSIGYNIFDHNVANEAAYVVLYGYQTTISALDGVGTQSGASTPDLSTATSIADTLALLKEQFPELWEKAITQNVIQLDGTIKTYVYIPVATPDAKSATDTQPTSGTSTQANPVVNPETSPDTLLDLIASISGSTPTLTDTNTESETGKGSTPSLIVPVGSASALYKIYNPTQEQLNSFGAWLWSSDFVDQLLKLFNDPMQAIIGLHKVYTPVSVGGTSDIKVGYLSSGVSSNYISNQYVSVDCGSIELKEFFNNIFDYDPYTDIHIYLPFIGIQKLNTGDMMRSSINVKYHVDVLTGACLAEINITRDGGGGILYTYSGNCAVQYPISSGSYMGIVASLASVTGGIVGTVATGGALAPMAIGAVGGLMNAHTSVSHSGGFSGNSGAMGIKIPYLIITRPQTELANTFPLINGYPTNYSVTLGQCSGYVEIENCHISGIPATDAELAEIETLLKSGVIL